MNFTFHYLLMANHLMLQKQLFNNIKDLKLTLGQPKVLDYLRENNGAMQKDIAKGCHIEPASLSTILNGMEKNGFITRNTDKQSRRNINIFMTEKGKKICEQIKQEFIEIESKALLHFSKEEIEQLTEYMMKIYNNLEERS
ncbi:MarR family transcriptional regulator [Clostridium sp. MD294]|uniref:MarR family winged helix-turn-helix transcriptional regulator n=1 Tax=Clostridium sp. MD294 TaxID=97138 RepID=UPI0002CB0776|nr:MarR family transcriptional regulator [Clostridium sp. MD294]NDO47000.1 MarR family transcriptional regulator [Clostridium sp. MD294]USF31249.1 Transcriptional regulator SlyA [Clostridium sp. MD294]